MSSLAPPPPVARMQYWNPATGRFTVDRGDVIRTSARLDARLVATAASGETSGDGIAPVHPGQVVVRQPPGSGGNGHAKGMPSCGTHVEALEDHALHACRFGYLHVSEDNTVRVVSPLVVEDNGMRAAWVNLDRRPHGLTRAIVEDRLSEAGITHGIDGQAIEEAVRMAREGEAGAVDVARGEPAQPVTTELIVDPDRSPPRVNEEGRLVLSGRSLRPRVTAGQCLLRCRLAAPGSDLFGGETACADIPIVAGEHVETLARTDETLFVADVDGTMSLDEGILNVHELLSISADVAGTTGPLCFPGEVCVEGPVRGPLTIESSGPATVDGDLLSGSTLTSSGDVLVSGAILGPRCHVTSGGDVEAAQTDGAQITASGDITLHGPARDARLRAGGALWLRSDHPTRPAAVTGGSVWARGGIAADQIGGPTGGATQVAVGVDPDQARALERLEHSLSVSYEQILRLLRRFQMNRIDVSQIRMMIRASRGAHRKALTHAARQLGHLAELYRDLQKRYETLQETIGHVDADIRANVVHAGVTVRVGIHRTVLKEPVENARFHANGAGLVSR